jgi:hypothetical protein
MSQVQLEAFFLVHNSCTAFPSTLVSMLELSPPLPTLPLLRVAGLSGLNTIIVQICCCHQRVVVPVFHGPDNRARAHLLGTLQGIQLPNCSLDVSTHQEGSATGQLLTRFLGSLLPSRKCWDGSQVLRCYYLLLMQPSRFKFIKIKRPALKALKLPSQVKQLVRRPLQHCLTILRNENYQIHSRTSRLVSITRALDNFLARNWDTRQLAWYIRPDLSGFQLRSKTLPVTTLQYL